MLSKLRKHSLTLLISRAKSYSASYAGIVDHIPTLGASGLSSLPQPQTDHMRHSRATWCEATLRSVDGAASCPYAEGELAEQLAVRDVRWRIPIQRCADRTLCDGCGGVACHHYETTDRSGATAATLTRQPFHARHGYHAGSRFLYTLSGGLGFPLVHMGKSCS
jgi:hypothetical protein